MLCIKPSLKTKAWPTNPPTENFVLAFSESKFYAKHKTNLVRRNCFKKYVYFKLLTSLKFTYFFYRQWNRQVLRTCALFLKSAVEKICLHIFSSRNCFKKYASIFFLPPVKQAGTSYLRSLSAGSQKLRTRFAGTSYLRSLSAGSQKLRTCFAGKMCNIF